MERPQDITTSQPERFLNRHAAMAVRLIIIFHLVGFIGLAITQTRPLFLQLVPYHLLFMALILFFNHDRITIKFIFFFTLIFILGFTAEWTGIHTSWPFGSYYYGKTLGLKVDGIPLIMGINWFLLLYAVGVTLQRSKVRQVWVRIITGAILLVLLDALIEPIANRLDYWHWIGAIPVNNYLSWFVLSALMLFIFELFGFKKQSMAGAVLLISQFIFFALLLIIT
jgi:putative membrane protein